MDLCKINQPTKKENMKTMTNQEIKLDIIRKLLMIETTSELKRIKEQCSTSISNEVDAENKEEKEFKEWKKNQQPLVLTKDMEVPF